MKKTIILAVVTAAFVLAAAGLLIVPDNRLVAGSPGPVVPEVMRDPDNKTLKAIDKGLTYLVNTQRSDGSWLGSGGMGSYPTVMTSLAGLALLASGSTPQSGPYYTNVRRAMEYVLMIAERYGKNDGMIAGEGQEMRSMYGHGFAMLFLAECYGMETNKELQERLKKALSKGVNLTIKAQSKIKTNFPKPYDQAGGWIYTPDGGGDEGSVTVTQLQALRACRNIGIKVPDEVIFKAVAYLKYCQNKDGGICYSANSRGGSTIAISSAAIACFYAAGRYDAPKGGKEGDFETKMVADLVKYCLANVRVDQSSGGHDFYTMFYLSQALYQRGGKDWESHYAKVRKKLLSLQAADGSWMGDSVGTTYGTAMACVILQLPYGYLPIYQR
ncbi:MAG: terpene cyclase/mutase family protein [Planctomycetes bacterium]|nr:terpene cyclase/mutase family protein [Planctomycetota bacterium]